MKTSNQSNSITKWRVGHFSDFKSRWSASCQLCFKTSGQSSARAGVGKLFWWSCLKEIRHTVELKPNSLTKAELLDRLAKQSPASEINDFSRLVSWFRRPAIVVIPRCHFEVMRRHWSAKPTISGCDVRPPFKQELASLRRIWSSSVASEPEITAVKRAITSTMLSGTDWTFTLKHGRTTVWIQSFNFWPIFESDIKLNRTHCWSLGAFILQQSISSSSFDMAPFSISFKAAVTASSPPKSRAFNRQAA